MEFGPASSFHITEIEKESKDARSALAILLVLLKGGHKLVDVIQS
jgi:hypothetical protein